MGIKLLLSLDLLLNVHMSFAFIPLLFPIQHKLFKDHSLMKLWHKNSIKHGKWKRNIFANGILEKVLNVLDDVLLVNIK